ncbi:EAL domain-containing protein [bacterium]|nr:MAG: EAL domain-containing protein [bacterium]
MSICKTCSVLPDPAPREGRVLLAVQTDATESALIGWAREGGLTYESVGSGLVAIDLHGDALDRLTHLLPELMSAPELERSRALLHQADEEMRPLHLLNADSIAAFVARVQGEWLTELLQNGHLDTAFQPICDLRTGEPVAHECLMRGSRHGATVYPGELIGTARATGLLFHLDRAARITAIENAARCGVETDIFINFNPTSIYNPAACLQTTVRAAARVGIDPRRIVFEVVESDEVRDTDHLLNILRFYRNEGFRVALDDLGAGYSSLHLLTQILPDVVKLDMGLIRGIETDPVRQKVVEHLLSLASSLGVTTVVEGVETPAERDFCRAAGADLVQGYLYGRPDARPLRFPSAKAA